MSAESYAEERFAAALDDPSFSRRLSAAGVADCLDVVVVADSTPVGEVLAQVVANSVVAVLDEDEPHGFALVRIQAAAS